MFARWMSLSIKFNVLSDTFSVLIHNLSNFYSCKYFLVLFHFNLLYVSNVMYFFQCCRVNVLNTLKH